MEKKMVRVPFNVDLAKKISKGEIEGRIVTRDGYSTRIICWNFKSDSYPIVALIDCGEEESLANLTLQGQYIESKESRYDLFLEIPEYLTFKDGDVLYYGLENLYSIFVYKSVGRESEDRIGSYCSAQIFKDGNKSFDLKGHDCFTHLKGSRYATEEEKQRLIDALKADKNPIAKEYLKKFFGIETKTEYKFQPFERVLVRDDVKEEWHIEHFCRTIIDEEDGLPYKYEGTSGTTWNYCIPYEGNEHLLEATRNVED